MGRAGRGIVYLGLALGLVPTAGCISRYAAELRASLVGVRSSRVLACMGNPTDVSLRMGSEWWSYQRPYDGPREDVNIEIASGPGTGATPPTVASGEVETESVKDTRTARPDTTRVPPGTCLLYFEMADKLVKQLVVSGRSFAGVNADDRCTLIARRCAPPKE